VGVARRARKRQRQIEGGRHTGADHLPGQPCPVCRPRSAAPGETLKAIAEAAVPGVISPRTLSDAQRARSSMGVGRKVGKLAREQLEAQQGLTPAVQRRGSRRGD
jgi:hypothetical protein